MDPWLVLAGLLVVLAGVSALYGMHRLGLWLERHGWLYYRNRKPGGGARSFIALQEFLEPPARHVFHIEDQRRWSFEEDAPGQGEPPRDAGDDDEDEGSGGAEEPPRSSTGD